MGRVAAIASLIALFVGAPTGRFESTSADATSFHAVATGMAIATTLTVGPRLSATGLRTTHNSAFAIFPAALRVTPEAIATTGTSPIAARSLKHWRRLPRAVPLSIFAESTNRQLNAKGESVHFDASTIFVIVLILSCVVWLTWAEIHSRRHHQPPAAIDDAGNRPEPPAGENRHHRRRS